MIIGLLGERWIVSKGSSARGEQNQQRRKRKMIEIENT